MYPIEVLGGCEFRLGEDEEKLAQLRVEIFDKIAALVTTAFGLVAALAWNEAIQAILSIAHTGTKADGKIFVSSVQDAYDIATKEKEEI